MSRPINKIIVHCSATKSSQNIGATEIDEWHIARGWSGIGYHYVIVRSGAIEIGRDIDSIGAHAKGFNTGSIGICLIGGLDDDGNPINNFTDSQMHTLESVISLRPGLEVLGHRDLPGVMKACPCFDVKDLKGV